MRALWFCVALMPVLAQADIYRWTDAQGKVHFSATPPAARPALAPRAARYSAPGNWPGSSAVTCAAPPARRSSIPAIRAGWVACWPSPIPTASLASAAPAAATTGWPMDALRSSANRTA